MRKRRNSSARLSQADRRDQCPVFAASLSFFGLVSLVPVLLVAFLLAYGAKHVGKAYNALSKIEWWARMITGWLFVLLGGYYSIQYVFLVE